MNAANAIADSNLDSIPPDQIQLQLERIIASSAFDASRRNRAFLRFIVEESLAGRADRIKAYTIATSVLGRDEAFDPQSDPIVRIEASRLRRSLERYYLMAGQDDSIRIDIPKWGYIPSFHRLQPVPEDAAPARQAAASERAEAKTPDLAEHREARTRRAGNLIFLPFRRIFARRLGSRDAWHGGHRGRDCPRGLARGH